jgi:hypothetical protein
MSAMTDLFGPPIHVYTVADGVADGSMIEAPASDVDEAGYRLPVTFTRAAWTDLVKWDDNPFQDEAGRLWDVLTMVRAAARRACADPGSRHAFQLVRVPYLTASGARSRAEQPRLTTAHVVAQGYDRAGRPCLTILLPQES